MYYYYDTETCGLYGLPITIQYALGQNEPKIHHIWKSKAHETLELIDDMMRVGVIGYNLTFDHFHLCKIYNMLRLMDPEQIPEQLDVETLVNLEDKARDGVALRPAHCLDLLLQIQKGKYQKCMERKPITIRKVPDVLAQELCDLLNEKIRFEPILFARYKDSSHQWKLTECKDKNKELIPGFYNIQCKFAPSQQLKDISVDMGLSESTDKFGDVAPNFMPTDLGFAPYFNAFRRVKKDQWKTVADYLVRKNKSKSYADRLNLPYFGAWPHVIKQHINHWYTDEDAKRYALKDVILLQEMHKAYPCTMDDDDSVLTSCVAACRWKGYAIDEEKILALKANRIEKIKKATGEIKRYGTINQVTAVRAFIHEVLSPIERVSIGRKTDKVTLEKLAERGDEAGRRAKLISDARKARKDIDIYDKLLIAGRFHASFRVIGTLSSRMSGSDGLNAHGLPKIGEMRECFPLAFDGEVLCGGDFSSQEVSIYQAVSNDSRLREELQSGMSIHGIFGTFVYPGMSYDDVMATKNTKDDKYKASKSAVFALFFGGSGPTLANRLGVELEVANKAHEQFLSAYPGAKAQSDKIKILYSPLKQSPMGSISFGEFQNYVESLYGFRRYFDMEFYACKELFELARNLPDEWKEISGKITRSEHKGEQTYAGACMSALYSAAFSVQNGIQRVANNHVIQSTGAGITKRVQTAVWELQPVGAHEWVVRPFSVHDEVNTPVRPDYVNKVKEIVDSTVDKISDTVPLISLDWGVELESWNG